MSCRRDMTLEMWTERQAKIQTFFGPGIKAEIDSPREGKVDVYLISDGRCDWLQSHCCSRHMYYQCQDHSPLLRTPFGQA